MGAFAQWVARKIKNHNPLYELSLADRSKKASSYTVSHSGKAVIDGRSPEGNVIYCEASELSGVPRHFRIMVEEIGEHEAPPVNARVKVGR